MRKKILRIQLIVGMGFFSVVVGSLCSAWILFHIPLGQGRLHWGLSLLLSHIWVLVILPAVAFGMSRMIELRRWTTACGAALAGEVFLLLLMAIAPAPDLPGSAKGWMLGVRVVTFLVGTALTGLVLPDDNARSPDGLTSDAE